ncbi:hypothetical protein PHMEG_00041487 [Phytophthora megakarya]|uniref:Uncharacterized protein n=1 Tax=Phytophthora megakarya TaxID=4795 RepID=A0A225UAY2_9STRA|nr:hypothetical protein PHMEG_00041487 [Phytophthora megakarya]
MGKSHLFLGMKVECVADATVLLTQGSYIEEIQHRFVLDATRPAPMPMVAITRLDFNNDSSTDAERVYTVKMSYRQLCYIYLVRVTRPEILFTVGQLTRHAAAPRNMAWDVVEYRFLYLRAITGLKMKFQPTSDEIVVATDADWASDREDRKRGSGSVLYLFGCPADGRKSSTAAEYISTGIEIEGTLMVQPIGNEVPQKDLSLKLKMGVQPSFTRLQCRGHSETQTTVDGKYHAVKDLIYKVS